MARILNRAWAAVASTGVRSDYLVTLEVTGRKSGRIVVLPLVMTVVDGQRYLVSMLGDDVQWVNNVRAAGGRAVLRSGDREEIQLEEVPTDQRSSRVRRRVDPFYSTVTEGCLALVAEAFVGSRMHVDFAIREPALTATAPGRAALGPRLTPVLVVMTIGTP